MNINAIYQKSAKGTEAIATRQHGLGPKQRSMLILVDGKRDFRELSRLVAMLGDPAQLLQELETGGFVELSATAPAPATSLTAQQGAASAVAPLAPAITAMPAIPLPDAKRLAVRKLTDAMGPMAESLCLRIEAARTAADFQAAISRAEGLLRQVRGAQVAAAFMADVGPRDALH